MNALNKISSLPASYNKTEVLTLLPAGWLTLIRLAGSLTGSRTHSRTHTHSHMMDLQLVALLTRLNQMSATELLAENEVSSKCRSSCCCLLLLPAAVRR